MSDQLTGLDRVELDLIKGRLSALEQERADDPRSDEIPGEPNAASLTGLSLTAVYNGVMVTSWRNSGAMPETWAFNDPAELGHFIRRWAAAQKARTASSTRS